MDIEGQQKHSVDANVNKHEREADILGITVWKNVKLATGCKEW